MARKYTFSGPDSCLDELSSAVQDHMHLPSSSSSALRSHLSHLAPAAIRRLPQTAVGPNAGQQFQRMDGRQAPPNNLFRDLAKISQFNTLASRLSHFASYSTFSNESTESLNTATSSAAASPCSVRQMMVKSRSSSQFISAVNGGSRRSSVDNDANKTPTGSGNGIDRDSSAPSSPSAGQQQIQREPASVPNFGMMQKSNSMEEGDDEVDGRSNQLLERAANALAQAKAKDGGDALELSDLRESDEADGSRTPSNEEASPSTANAKDGNPSVPRSDSAFTFQSYDCSSSRSSTLSSQASSGIGGGAPGGGGRNNNAKASPSDVEREKFNSRLCKSSSVNHGFEMGSEGRLVQLGEEEEDGEAAAAEAAAAFYSSQEFSSLSGYESLESSGGDQRTSAAVSELGEDCGGGSLLSFPNPHYLAPDVQAMVDRRRAERSNCLLRRDESHQSFAQALNSPADSLFSDYQV